MKPLLLTIDFQEDFLAEAGLEPHRETVTAGALTLLQAARERQIPVGHVWTTVRKNPDQRMAHWKAAGRWSGLEGTPGHQPGRGLEPQAGEKIFHKTVFSGWSQPALAQWLETEKIDTLVLMGVHLHTCVRQTALDAYQQGLTVWIATEAVASYDPWQGAQTELYLARRGISFFSTAELLERWEGGPQSVTSPLPSSVLVLQKEDSTQDGPFYRHLRPGHPQEPAWAAVAASPKQIEQAVEAAGNAQPIPGEGRLELLERAAQMLKLRTDFFADQITQETGKPIRYARAEVDRTIRLLQAVASRMKGQRWEKKEAEATVYRRPHGVVALITPWNNPLAIAAGQWAPAWACGNSVVWKPAWAGFPTASAFHQLLLEAGLPPAGLQVVGGDDQTGLKLIEAHGVQAVCFTGSCSAGWKVRQVCASQGKPLQAELGGNNGVIIGEDVENLRAVAEQIAEGAFGCAGQRCTATRRVIIEEPKYAGFVAALEKAVAALAWGAPDQEITCVGPLLSVARVDRISGYVERAAAAGLKILQPHGAGRPSEVYYPPTLVFCNEPEAEIVQEETFGPILVVQRARDWQQAMAWLNGVRPGLVAALFSHDPRRQESFRREAQAGLLKINRSTVEAGVDVPFGGWKASGTGYPQHGEANLEFFTRWQTVYLS